MKAHTFYLGPGFVKGIRNFSLLLLVGLPSFTFSQTMGEEIQELDADSLFFNDEYEFRSFLQFHELKEYSIKPQTDFFDCTVNPGTMIYPPHENDDFLHEERFFGLPFVFIIDHNGTRKIYDLLIPSYEDSTITTCDVRLILYDSIHNQHVVFNDIFNWIDENGRNIFNLNKKLYFLFGYNSGTYNFPGEMLQVSTGIDFTFPDYFPEDQGPIQVVFTSVDVYTQYHYYEDLDLDGYGDSFTDSLDYEAPLGYITNGGDCDDANPDINPGAFELCNGFDDNCNELIDEESSTLVLESLSDVICLGDTALITTDFLDGFTYSWYRNGELIDTLGSNIYPATELGNYYIIAFGPDDCMLISDSLALDVLPNSPVNILIGGDADLCTAPGVGTVKLKTTATAGSTIEWFKDGLLIEGATSRFFIASETGDYHSTVTNINGCSLSSDPITVSNSCRLSSGLNVYDKWLVSPNPSSGSISIKAENIFELFGEIRLEVWSINGNLLQQQISLSEDSVFQFSMDFEKGLMNGCYFVVIRNQTNVQTFPILLIR